MPRQYRPLGRKLCNSFARLSREKDFLARQIAGAGNLSVDDGLPDEELEPTITTQRQIVHDLLLATLQKFDQAKCREQLIYETEPGAEDFLRVTFTAVAELFQAINSIDAAVSPTEQSVIEALQQKLISTDGEINLMQILSDIDQFTGQLIALDRESTEENNPLLPDEGYQL